MKAIYKFKEFIVDLVPIEGKVLRVKDLVVGGVYTVVNPMSENLIFAMVFKMQETPKIARARGKGALAINLGVHAFIRNYDLSSTGRVIQVGKAITFAKNYNGKVHYIRTNRLREATSGEIELLETMCKEATFVETNPLNQK